MGDLEKIIEGITAIFIIYVVVSMVMSTLAGVQDTNIFTIGLIIIGIGVAIAAVNEIRD